MSKKIGFIHSMPTPEKAALCLKYLQPLKRTYDIEFLNINTVNAGEITANRKNKNILSCEFCHE